MINVDIEGQNYYIDNVSLTNLYDYYNYVVSFISRANSAYFYAMPSIAKLSNPNRIRIYVNFDPDEFNFYNHSIVYLFIVIHNKILYSIN